MAFRRVRQSDANSCQISVLSLEALLSLSAASAKLNLRKQVLKCEAVIAIVLFEETMVSRFGYSVIEVNLELRLTCLDGSPVAQ